MYVFLNSLKNIRRNIGRNALLGVLSFAIIGTVVVALMISNTSSAIINDYKNRFGAEISIQPDVQQIMASRTSSEQRPEIPEVTPQQYNKISQSDLLQKAEMTADASVYTKKSTGKLEQVKDSSSDSNGSNGKGFAGGAIMRQGQDAKGFVSPEFTLSGGSVYSEFDTGSRKLKTGKLPENNNQAVVSDDLAKKNNLKVGSKITVYGNLLNSEKTVATAKKYTLTITGIFYDATSSDSQGAGMMMPDASRSAENLILTTYDTVTNSMDSSKDGVRVSGTFYLKSPNDLDSFKNFVYGLGVSKKMAITANEADYNKVVGPVESMRNISISFMLVVLALGTIILLLISSIAIRERKYEIGVLRSMGMKNKIVALGLWFEMLIMTISTAVAGLLVGAIAAQPITNTLLSQQIQKAQDATNVGGMMGAPGSGGGPTLIMNGKRLGGSSSTATALDHLTVHLTGTTLLQIILTAVALATIASVVAIIRITKYEPIKILSERN